MMREGGEEISGRIGRGFQLMLGRAATPQEVEQLAADYASYQGGFNAAEAEKMLKIGDKPRDAELDPVELAATTLLASTILNLNKTLTHK